MFKRAYFLGLWLSVFAVLCALVETFKYPGFIVKHTGIEPLYIYIVTGLYVKIFPPPNPHEKYVARSFRYLALFSLTIAGFLLIIETVTYPNYIFTYLHIHLAGLQLLTLLLFAYFVLTNLLHVNLNVLLSSTAILAIISILFNYTIANFINVSTLVRKEVGLLIKGGKSVEDKQIAGWGDIYLYAELVKKVTPETAVIAMPPAQNHWLYTGNLVLMRYFLYPRVLINVKETSSESTLLDLPSAHYEYVALVWGEANESDKAPHGWPKIPIKSEYVELFDLHKQTALRQNLAEYIPEQFDTPSTGWGIIKVKK